MQGGGVTRYIARKWAMRVRVFKGLGSGYAPDAAGERAPSNDGGRANPKIFGWIGCKSAVPRRDRESLWRGRGAG